MAKRAARKRRPPVRRKGRAAAKQASRETPRQSSIVSVDTLTSPKGRRYTILETDQMDPYDDPGQKPRKGRR